MVQGGFSAEFDQERKPGLRSAQNFLNCLKRPYMLQNLILWLESHLGTCRFHEQTDLSCQGCGLQRAVIALLKGDLIESLILFPPLLPLLIMFSFLAVHLIFNLRHGALVLKIMYMANAATILLNFIIKLILN